MTQNHVELQLLHTFCDMLPHIFLKRPQAITSVLVQQKKKAGLHRHQGMPHHHAKVVYTSHTRITLVDTTIPIIVTAPAWQRQVRRVL